MGKLLALGMAFAIGLTALGVAADELAVDSGWVEVKPSDLQRDREFERFTYSNVRIEERDAVQTDALNIVNLAFDIKNKTEEDVYFDLDAMALVEKGRLAAAGRNRLPLTHDPPPLDLPVRHIAVSPASSRQAQTASQETLP